MTSTLPFDSSIPSRHSIANKHSQLPYQSRLAGLSVDQCEASWTISPAQERGRLPSFHPPSLAHSPRLINLGSNSFPPMQPHTQSAPYCIHRPENQAKGSNEKRRPFCCDGACTGSARPGGRASVGDDEICRHSQQASKPMAASAVRPMSSATTNAPPPPKGSRTIPVTHFLCRTMS